MTTLDDFKRRHERKAGTHPSEVAPFCSDTHPTATVTLMFKEGFTESGLVNCSTHFPFEGHRGVYPTIANVDMTPLIYAFIDGKLASITGIFENMNFQTLAASLEEKFGPAKKRKETVKNAMGASFENNIYTWRKGNEVMELWERMPNALMGTLMIRSTALEAEREKRIKSIKPKNPDL